MLPEISKIAALPLGSVKMTDPYCVNAVKKEVEYLKAFEVDRVLAGFRKNAGIKTSAEPYGGWESHLIGGHAMGHYFSAISQASVDPGVCADDRNALKSKLSAILSGLEECQSETGFLWAGRILNPENPEIQFDLVEQGRGNEDIINVAWVPWYTMHKILAGLLSAYEIAGEEKALEIAKKLGGWVCGRALSWSEKTRAVVLNTEYGGMNDVMYELYRATGEARFAEAAHVFDEEPLFDDILTNRENLLTGRHANTTIPKIIGALRRYQVMGEKLDCGRYLKVAEAFWSNVTENHTYHTGGNSEWEHFREDGELDKNRNNCNCETCNVYNMLKLTKELFKITGEKKYADYMENAFINHILASQSPETGMTTYFQSMATGYFKVFSSRWEDFWCCTGSGMENFTKLGELSFFGGSDRLWVLRYLSCELRSGDIFASLTSDIENSGKVLLKVCGVKTVTLRLPDWSDGIKIFSGGKSAEYHAENGFIDIPAGEGAELEITFTPKLAALPLSGGKGVVALKYGPWLLAAKLGKENMTETRTGVHVAIPEKSVSDGVLKIGGSADELIAEPQSFVKKLGPAEFELGGLKFIPYYLIEERYGIYWKIEK